MYPFIHEDVTLGLINSKNSEENLHIKNIQINNNEEKCVLTDEK